MPWGADGGDALCPAIRYNRKSVSCSTALLRSGFIGTGIPNATR